MRVKLEYGRTGLIAELPDERVVRTLHYKDAPPLPDPHASLSEVLQRPNGTPVTKEIGARLKRTAQLAFAAMAVAILLAVPLGTQNVATAVAPQLAAVIAAAVSVVLDRPYRLVSVQQVTVPVVPHLNVWAVEGRTQIFMSHKVR